MKQKIRALKIRLEAACTQLHCTSIIRLLKVSVLKKYMMQLCYLIVRIMCCVVQSGICLGITDSHIIISRDFPFLTLAVLVATLLGGMNHMWWRRWVCTCRLNRNQLAIFYNPYIVQSLEDGLAACFICCWKAFSLGCNNFNSVDYITAFSCWNMSSQKAAVTGLTHISWFRWEHHHRKNLPV